MANNIPITQGSGQSSVAAETVGGISYQQIEVYGAGGSSVMSIDPSGAVRVSVVGTITVSGMQGASVSGTVGASVIGIVPVQIPSSVAVAIISGSIAASFTPPANQSVSGTVQTDVRSSVAVVIIGGSIAASFTPPANQSVSGTVGASVIGTVPVTFVNSSISGTVTVTALQGASVSGTVGASIIGMPPFAINTQAGGPVGGGFALSDGTSSVFALGTAGYNLNFNGATWDRVRGNSSVGTLVAPYAYPASFISGVTSVITGTSSVQVLVPAPTGQRNYITNVLVTNAAAVGTVVELFDGGNVVYAGFAAASGGGFSASFPVPLKQSSIAGNLSALSTVQASVYVSASGYTAN